jgi:DNA polymerase III delta subunit
MLDSVGAGTISFNPVTANNIVKALNAVAAKEGAALDADTAVGIAAAAGGDLRNALQNLQMLIGRQGGQQAGAGGGSSKGGGGKKGKVCVC